MQVTFFISDPEGIQTPNLLIRSQMRYSVTPRSRIEAAKVTTFYKIQSERRTFHRGVLAVSPARGIPAASASEYLQLFKVNNEADLMCSAGTLESSGDLQVVTVHELDAHIFRKIEPVTGKQGHAAVRIRAHGIFIPASQVDVVFQQVQPEFKGAQPVLDLIEDAGVKFKGITGTTV